LLMKGLLFPAAGSGTTIYSWLYSHYFSEAGFYNGALLQAICYMLLSWVLVWILNKKQYYLKI
jgi:predicted acyltransferase